MSCIVKMAARCWRMRRLRLQAFPYKPAIGIEPIGINVQRVPASLASKSLDVSDLVGPRDVLAVSKSGHPLPKSKPAEESPPSREVTA